MKKDDTPLKDVLKNVLSGLEKREEEETAFLDVWRKTIGEEAAKHTKIDYIKGTKMLVSVSDSSRLYKLTCDKKKIIKNLNKKANKQIKEIQFRIGEI